MKTLPNILTIDIPATTLKVGDRIPLAKGTHTRVKTVVFPARGCGNVHVVTDAQRMVQCYDRVATVTVIL